MFKNMFYTKLTLLLLSFAILAPFGNSAFGTLTCTASAFEYAQTAVSSSQTANVSDDEKLAFDLLNSDREANGLLPLKLNLAVSAVAQRHAQDEIDRVFFSHTNPDGLSPFDRMRAAGISYRSAGENLAIDQNIAAAEQALMNSPGHRANILNPGYTGVGIGIRYDSQGSLYIVQCFIGQ